MEAVGIICEYNPLHKGHIYHIEQVKKLYPGRAIVLVINGYFLERGEISILSKENKTKLALIYGVDLVVELPFIMGTQSADIFAQTAVKILNNFGVKYLVFGSECNNIDILKKAASIQEDNDYQKRVKEYLEQGVNYPTALAKALNIKENIYNPNDLLGISYIKAINKYHFNIEAVCIKRTSEYHSKTEDKEIISASNIRNKIKLKQDISLYTPRKVIKLIEDINMNDLFPFIKYKILTDNDLSRYLTVDEGIENRLKEKILDSLDYEDFVKNVKTKRYTYNKICRMLIHILVGVPKDINNLSNLPYVKVLGFNSKGRAYLRELKEDLEISLIPIPNSLQYKYELIAASIYSLVSKYNVIKYEKSNKPIYFE